MGDTSVRGHLKPLHPLHAIFLAFPLPLFLGGLLSDLAYRASFHVQWANFASWMIAGGLLVGAFALLWALIDFVRDAPERDGRAIAYCVALLLMWVLGLVNAFVHAKDAWAIMPEAVYLSLIVTALALVAAWIGYSAIRVTELR